MGVLVLLVLWPWVLWHYRGEFLDMVWAALRRSRRGDVPPADDPSPLV